MKKFIEVVCLMLLAGFLLVCLGNAIKKRLDEKEETPIVDVEKEEIQTSTFTISTNVNMPFTFTYEVGMTWEEFLNSDYNTFDQQLADYIANGKCSNGSFGINSSSNYVTFRIDSDYKTSKCLGTDLITDVGLIF